MKKIILGLICLMVAFFMAFLFLPSDFLKNYPQLSDKVGKDEAQVVMQTNQGDITIKLFPKEAPLAVQNFLTHAKAGYYDNLSFHRVIEGFAIQGGDPEGTGEGGKSIWAGKDSKIDAGQGFADEFSPNLFNIRGALSMANSGADTNGSQFFINQNAEDQSQRLDDSKYPSKIIKAYTKGGNPYLDGVHTVFGQVTDGMKVVDKIAQTEADDQGKPKKDILIKKIKIIKDYKFKK